MSSEEKIKPDEFDQELEALMSGEGKTGNRKKRKLKKRWIALAVLVLAGAAGVRVLGQGQTQAPQVPVISPTRQDVQNRLSVTGPISGTDSVDVVSNLHAEVLEIPVREGDRVVKGQTLARLDETDLKKQVDIAKNDYDLAVSTCAERDREAKRGYEKAVQDLQAAQTNFDRTKALFDSGSMSQAELETAQNALNDAARATQGYTMKNGQAVADDSYRLQIEKARFDYEKAKEQLEDANITSPIDGTVVRVNIKVGRFADKMENEEPMFIIENLDNLEMEIKVSEYSIGKVAVGQEAQISADILNGDTVRGQVVSISPTGEEKGGGSTERVIPTKIQILDDDTKLIAGITARADILLEEAKDALSLPVSAVYSQDGSDYVFEVKNGIVHWVPVELGVEGDINVEVAPKDGETLDETSQVLASPNPVYAEGMAVTAAVQ